jgi:hypothetical protein
VAEILVPEHLRLFLHALNHYFAGNPEHRAVARGYLGRLLQVIAVSIEIEYYRLRVFYASARASYARWRFIRRFGQREYDRMRALCGLE